jgi:HEAT repeat protein
VTDVLTCAAAGVPEAVAEVLASAGPAGVAILRSALGDPSALVRRAGLEMLARVPTAAGELGREVQALADADPDPRVRQRAAALFNVTTRA